MVLASVQEEIVVAATSSQQDNRLLSLKINTKGERSTWLQSCLLELWENAKNYFKRPSKSQSNPNQEN